MSTHLKKPSGRWKSGLTERKKLRFKKDVKDKNTWTSPKRRVSDDRCRERNWRVYHPIDSVNDISFSMGKDKTSKELASTPEEKKEKFNLGIKFIKNIKMINLK